MAFHTFNFLRGRNFTSCPALPTELLAKIFEELLHSELPDPDFGQDAKDLDEFLVGRRSLVACSLVDRQWYYAATHVLWRNPIFPSIKSFNGFLTALHPTIDPTNPASIIFTPVSDLPAAYPIGQSGRNFVRSLKFQFASETLCSELDLSLSKFVRDDHITALAQLSYSSLDGEDIPCFPNLEKLSLSGCEAITDASALPFIAAHARSLKSIDLSGCRHITDTIVQLISNLSGSHMEEIRLRNCGLVSDVGVNELASTCSALKKLDIGWCRRVSDRALLALASRNLEELDITGCRAITLAGLTAFAASGSQNLSRFSFHSPTLSQTAQVQPTQQITTILKSLPKTLCSLAIFQAGNLLADHVSLVGELFPSLTSFTLEGFRDLSEATFETFTKLPLEELRLPSCRRVDDCCLCILATSPHAGQLRILDLSDCADISDTSLLRLAGVDARTPKTLSTSTLDISAALPKLHTLLLANNRRVTVRGLVPAIRGLKGLRYLDVSGTGEGIVEPFRSVRPYVPPPTASFGLRHFLQLHAPRDTGAYDESDRATLGSEVGDALGSGSSVKKNSCVVRGWAALDKVREWNVEALMV